MIHLLAGLALFATAVALDASWAGKYRVGVADLMAAVAGGLLYLGVRDLRRRRVHPVDACPCPGCERQRRWGRRAS